MPVLATTEALAELTREAVGRIETSAAATIHVLLNGLRGPSPEEFRDDLARRCRFPVEVSAGERSVAASWNEGCRRALLDGADYVLLMANDALLEPAAVDCLLEFGASAASRGCAAWSARAINYPPRVDPATVWQVFRGCWVTDAADYTCCMLRPETLARHGWFDQNFRPAYFEDVDYQARVNRTEDWTATLHAAPMTHHGSATYRNDPEARQRVDAAWAANARYFEAKWGLPRPRTFRPEIRRDYHPHPWNDPSRPLHAWDGPTPDTLGRLYDRARATPSDVREHLETLHRLAGACRHVTEFGTRTGVSTTALLAARPETLVCYDLVRHKEVTVLEAVAKEPGRRTDFRFRQEDVLAAEIEPTEMLFIDTLHTEGQMARELARHAGRVSRHLVFHDTETFGRAGELPGTAGIGPAIAAHVGRHPEWRLTLHRPNNNGLTVYTRLG
jgi:hypothetical protein